MERKYDIGSHVKFVNPKGEAQDALITIWWQDSAHYKKDEKAECEPGCNLVIVSDDEHKTDSCGRQTEHETSVVHKSNQPAHGNYWCWPDEL